MSAGGVPRSNRSVRLYVDIGVDSTDSDEERLVRALYARYGASLFGYVLWLNGGDRGRAEDVVQETLVRAWRNPDALAERDRSIRPWLYTVARNLVIDGHRARRARPPEVSDGALAAIPQRDELERALESWAVEDALGELRPEHRSVLLETYYRGRSVAEAAATLSIPEGTVKSRTYYALRALKLALEERGLAP